MDGEGSAQRVRPGWGRSSMGFVGKRQGNSFSSLEHTDSSHQNH